MKEKLQDAEYDVNVAKKELTWKYREYNKCVMKNSRTDIFFRIARKAYIEKIWNAVIKDISIHTFQHFNTNIYSLILFFYFWCFNFCSIC